MSDESEKLPLHTEYRILLSLTITTMRADLEFLEKELARLDKEPEDQS